ncbi:hypothetical protein BDV93DRAFT_586999 [Ceratobasidium sp. AG-I]|nr:hypothetical protein BDV93DRAFT_586999 [Ceratobasidium sp. AG-I]
MDQPVAHENRGALRAQLEALPLRCRAKQVERTHRVSPGVPRSPPEKNRIKPREDSIPGIAPGVKDTPRLSSAQRVVKGLVRIKRSRSRRGAEPSSTRREKGSGEGARPRIIQTRSMQVGHGLDAPIGGEQPSHALGVALPSSQVKGSRTGRQANGWDVIDERSRAEPSGRRVGPGRREGARGIRGTRSKGSTRREWRHNTGIDPGVLSNSNCSSWFGSGHAVVSKPRRWGSPSALFDSIRSSWVDSSHAGVAYWRVRTERRATPRVWLYNPVWLGAVELDRQRSAQQSSGRTAEWGRGTALGASNRQLATPGGAPLAPSHFGSIHEPGEVEVEPERRWMLGHVGRKLDVMGRNDDARSILAWSGVVWVNGRDEGGPERCQRARQVVEARSSLSTRRFVRCTPGLLPAFDQSRNRSMASGSCTNPSETGTGPERHWGARAVREARSEGSTCRVVKATPVDEGELSAEGRTRVQGGWGQSDKQRRQCNSPTGYRRRTRGGTRTSGTYPEVVEPERRLDARAIDGTRSEGSTCRVVRTTPGRSWRLGENVPGKLALGSMKLAGSPVARPPG